MRAALFIARFDLGRALRQRETLVWVFVMPIVFFYFIGTVTGGGSRMGAGAESETLELVAGHDAGFLEGELARELARVDYEVARLAPDDAGEPGEETPRLSVPSDFTERVLAGEPTSLALERGSDGLGADYASFRVGRAVYTLLASLAATAAAGQEPTAEALARLAAEPRALELDVRPAGRRQRVPQGFEQTIPGTMVMFTMIVLLTSGAVGLVIERREGVLRRLASAPIDRGQVVLGKWLALVALGLVQVGAGMLLGTLIFGMRWGPDLGAVIGVLVAWAALVASLAILLGSLAKTEGQAIGIGVIASNVLAALGGCWWPIEVTPAWMQKLALFLPSGWAMDAMHQLAIFQNGAASALFPALGLALGALAAGFAAARRFRFQ